MNRQRLRLALAGGLAISLLSMPAPAIAVPGIQRVVGATASAVTISHTLVLTCPAGKVAIGAGASVLGTALDTHVTGFWPEGNKVTLTASSERNPATATWALQGMAICATSAADFQYVASPVAGDVLDAAYAVCPAGKVVIGMGVRTSFGRLLYALPFDPAGTPALTAVTGAVTRVVSTVPSSVQSMAVCGNASRASQAVRGQTVGTAPVQTASATCPAGTQLHAIGGHTHYPDQPPPASHSLFTGFNSSFAQPNLAVVQAREKVDNIPAQYWSVEIVAICAP
jgi:hypothetical protein